MIYLALVPIVVIILFMLAALVKYVAEELETATGRGNLIINFLFWLVLIWTVWGICYTVNYFVN